VDVNTAVRGRGPESGLIVGKMVRASVGASVESSEVAAESCFLILMSEEQWKHGIIWVVGDTPHSGDSSGRCMWL
jgi:hypothetical protein